MLELELKKFIQGYEKIIIICMGNDMRGDDSAGPIVAETLRTIIGKNPNIMVVNAGTVPENYTGLIRTESPTHIIFIDAVEMNLKPGTLRLVRGDEIANYSISTHAMPLSFMIKYLKSFSDADIILIGIQPKGLDMFSEISKELEMGIEELMKDLQKIFLD